MKAEPGVPRKVLIRDLLLFQAKLLVDSFKDLVLVQAAIVAAVIDLVLGNWKRGRLFYSVVRLSERFDLWLNLNSAASRAESHEGGLWGATARGTDGVLACVERVLRSAAERARDHWRDRRRGQALPRAEPVTAGWDRPDVVR